MVLGVGEPQRRSLEPALQPYFLRTPALASAPFQPPEGKGCLSKMVYLCSSVLEERCPVQVIAEGDCPLREDGQRRSRAGQEARVWLRRSQHLIRDQGVRVAIVWVREGS